MTQRTLQKWHGAGNDFLVEVNGADAIDFWTPSRVVALCARATGVGADGLLLATVHDRDVEMILFNADASRAEMSGNGIRCLVAAVRRATGDTREVLNVATDAGNREVTLRLSDDHGWGDVDMGPVTLSDALAGSAGVAYVGNPHVVVLDDAAWSKFERESMATSLADQMGGANVEFVRIIDATRITMTVLERGAGWTLACGTGSVAAVAVLQNLGMVGEVVSVENPGGELAVTLIGGQARLGGPVRFVADIAWVGQ